MVKYKYTKEQLQEAVASSQSVMGVMRVLGVKMAGGSHTHISNRIKAEGIDTSHFTAQAWNKGKPGYGKRNAESILVLGDPTQPRVKVYMLRRALRELGKLESCWECGQGDVYNNKPLQMEIDHINGHHWDNREDNLRYLCPNCHSQQDTNKPWKYKNS